MLFTKAISLPNQFSAWTLLIFYTLSIICCGAVLCLIGYLAVSLASTYLVPVVPSPLTATTEKASKHCQVSASVHLG